MGEAGAARGEPSTEGEGVLMMWTVYERPTDFPNSFVARRWRVTAEGAVATGDLVLAGTLERIREALPPGLYRLPREAEDDPVIVETWF